MSISSSTDARGATEAEALVGAAPTPGELRAAFRTWLATEGHRLPPSPEAERDFSKNLNHLRTLQRALFDVGWVRFGWPESFGGLGGGTLHRAVLYDELSAAGFPSRSAFEHIEILAPPVCKHWRSEELAGLMKNFLSGEEVWCQGFSEPDAGSDLGSLKTHATATDGGYLVSGRKIWTSWATEAGRCLLLARTGTPEDRHRGISAFLVDMRSPGIEVQGIAQANGVVELAEVTFDDVFVPDAALIGSEGGGWQIAMEILIYERAANAWLRSATLFARVDALAPRVPARLAGTLGDVLLDLFAVRCASADALEAIDANTFVGPMAAPVKLALTDTEQHLHDLSMQVHGEQIALGSSDPLAGIWQDDWFFSRAVSIYGGTRQMQLTTIARHILRMGAQKP